MNLLWVGIGGFLGANARYLLGGWISNRVGVFFPYGTLAINITGSFILGLFLSIALERAWLTPGWRLFFATGFVGAYTTFSTFEYESMMLLREGQLLLFGAYFAGSVIIGLAAVLVGAALGQAI
ncbi:MAG: fluoride efflux transporter CrcB [Candidatus Binataceae bacterium]